MDLLFASHPCSPHATELILDTQDDLNKALVYPLAWLAFVGYSLITVLCASALVVYWQVRRSPQLSFLPSLPRGTPSCDLNGLCHSHQQEGRAFRT